MLPAQTVTGPIDTPEWAIHGVWATRVYGWVMELVSGRNHVPWRRCWELLHKAVARYPGPDAWTQAELLRQILAGKCQLWIAWSYGRRRIEGAVITRLVNDTPMAPGERVCEVVLVGGVNGKEWLGGMLGLLKAWALDQGCTWLGGPARKGWMRALGFVEVGKTEQGLPILAMPLKGVH